MAAEVADEAKLIHLANVRIARVGWWSALSGALVTFLAVGFLMPLVGISTRQEVRSGLINGGLITLYLIVGWIFTSAHTRPHTARVLAWLPAGRAPTPHERRCTLALALHAVKVDALLWALAAVLFGVLNGLIVSWSLGAVVGITIWLGAETTCALGYMLYERALRPVTARALAFAPGAATAPGVRLRLAMAWLLGTGVPLVGVLALGAFGAFGSSRHPQYVGAAVLFLGCVAVATGYTATVLAAKAISDPLRAVRAGLSQIERGELGAEVTVDDGSEVGQLQAGFNRMAEGLRERQRIRELFGRQVGEHVARAALRDGVRFGGEEREVAALFVDIVGSTALALALPPNEVVALLNRFFRVVVEVVEDEDGLVNKFEGDAALCVFGAPVAREDPAGDCLRAARVLAGRLSRELPDIDFGIGVSAGPAVAGNVGAEQRFEYTVIGDPVNEAARLAELAKQRPERVLGSLAAIDRAAGDEVQAWQLTESAQLRGRLAPTQLAHPVRVEGALATRPA
jgi:adenylate cyclase